MFHALRQSSDYITIITTPFGVSTHECTWQKIGQVAIEMIKFSRKPKQLNCVVLYRHLVGFKLKNENFESYRHRTIVDKG